ncbi:MAG: alternative ribosome rescue aminoacyl-tRNA hydrolase ArfB [Desulfocapsaceae bacterium]|nr:alternative ribosome rescue aminoacyl-tRNA hydrolase ArfB [Desulfocapsaceae bacterium]
MWQISTSLKITEKELSFSQIRAQGAGGQNVNKVSSAVQLRFDIIESSLPEPVKKSLLALPDKRISNDGVVIIKAQNFRTYERNKEDALVRLANMIRSAAKTRKKRKQTRPSKSAKQKRMDQKTRRGKVKQLRKKVL